MNAHSVALDIVGGSPASAERFRRAAPDRLMGSVIFPCTNGRSPNLYFCFENGGDWPDLDILRAEVEAGRVSALGELYNVYAGISPLDPRMKPYYALTAEYDLIVLAHAERGPPLEDRAPNCCPHFEEDHGNPHSTPRYSRATLISGSYSIMRSAPSSSSRPLNLWTPTLASWSRHRR